MRQITLYIFTLGLALACVSAELQHRQRENFHYSSSSKKIVNGNVVDEDDKSGFHRKQTGNMGGNYEESENMDTDARRKMEDMMRLAREGLGGSHSLGGGAAPALGPMGIPVFMTSGGSSGQHLHSGALTSGVLVDDCDDVTGVSRSHHQNMNAASSQYARTGTLITPVVRPVIHRTESASQYAARSESGSRMSPVAVLIPTSYVGAADSERYRDNTRRTVYSPVLSPVDTVHRSSHQQAAEDRYASESRRYPIVHQPTVHESESQAAAVQQQYSRSHVVEPQRTIPVSYTSGSHAAEQHGHSSQFHARDERRYDSTHDDVNRRRGSSYVTPVQSEVLHTAESQRYGNRDYEESYRQPTATIRAPHYTSQSEIDRHIQNLDRTVESFQHGRPADRNVVTPRPKVDADYDDDQQVVQQSYDAASSSAFAQQQSSRDILHSARPQPVSGYASGSRGYQQGYSSSGYEAGSRRGVLQSASSTVEGRVVPAPHGYNHVDQGAVDRSTYSIGRRGNAEELGQEASDLLGAAGAAKPGGSYRQESDDSMSYGYHRTGTFGADRADGVRGTYARDGNVAATSKKAEDVREENGRVKFSAESSHSKHEEYSERRNFEFPAGTAVNPVTQAEIDRMSPEQKRAYWQQYGQRFNEFASKLHQQHGY